jgi:photosystem II stability/assembly factor-like uncharacterized protein
MRRIPSLLGSLFALLILDRSVAFAGVGAWTTNGPQGADPRNGYVNVVSDSRTPGLVYVGSASGVFKSLDNGSTWHSAGLLGQVTTPLATGPDGVVLVSAGYPVPILYESTDGGDNWTEVPESEYTYEAAVDTFTPTTLYRVSMTPVGGVPPELTPSTLWRSVDGGSTWGVIDPPDKYLGFFGDLVVDPSVSGTLYVTAPVLEIVDGPKTPPIVVSSLFKSVDSGSTWTRLGGGGQQLAIDPTAPSTLYLVANYSAQKTTDGGKTFSEIDVLGLAVTEIRVDPRHPNRVYALAGDTAVGSSDGGDHWWPMPIVPYPLHLTIDVTGEFLHVSSGYAVFDYQVPERLPVESPHRNPSTRVAPVRTAD